uniref:Uncharacterized protein n=1 Tax=Sphaerodactylus townsendi TaxID=933632 RepID=A0ACB8FQH7_9SAUR
MDALKSAGRAIIRSPSIAKQNWGSGRHKNSAAVIGRGCPGTEAKKTLPCHLLLEIAKQEARASEEESHLAPASDSGEVVNFLFYI